MSWKDPLIHFSFYKILNCCISPDYFLYFSSIFFKLVHALHARLLQLEQFKSPSYDLAEPHFQTVNRKSIHDRVFYLNLDTACCLAPHSSPSPQPPVPSVSPPPLPFSPSSPPSLSPLPLPPSRTTPLKFLLLPYTCFFSGHIEALFMGQQCQAKTIYNSSSKICLR